MSQAAAEARRTMLDEMRAKVEAAQHFAAFGSNLGVSENVVYYPKPNGFADHYPYEKWLFHWEYTQHFQTNPSFPILAMEF